jgi:hypothetical protein
LAAVFGAAFPTDFGAGLAALGATLAFEGATTAFFPEPLVAGLTGAFETLAGAGFGLDTTFTGALLLLESFDFFEADDTGVAFFAGTLLFLDLDAIRTEM